MGKPGPRYAGCSTNNSFIIKSKKIWWREIIVAMITLLLWVYCGAVVFFYLDALLALNHDFPQLFRTVFKITNVDVKNFIKLIWCLFSMAFFTLFIWSYYNRRRFGSLTRRHYPSETTKEDLLKLNMIDEETYDKLQNSKVIVFEKNPIKD